MSKIILPTSEQIFGNDKLIGNKKLKIFEKYGSKCAMSDLAICLGAYVSSDVHLDNKNSFVDRTGWYWTMTPYSGNARAVANDGYKN